MYSMVIADDEVEEQRVLQKIVRDFCPAVRLLPCCSNGAELISSTVKERPDIIVLDINMPVLNGLDVLEWLKLKEISVKILVVSAYHSFQYVQESMNLGADGYLLKPVNEKLFADTVKKLCRALDKEKDVETELCDLEKLKTEYKKVLENELISDLLLEEINFFSIKKYAEYFNQEFHGGGTCFIRSGDLEKGDIEHLLNMLNKFCNCFWKKYQNFIALCLLTNTKEQGEKFERWTEELFCHARKRLPFFQWDRMLVGISTWKAAIEELPCAMRESRIALQGKEKAGFYTYRCPFKLEEEQSFHKEFYECRCLLKFSKAEEKLKAYVRKIEQRERNPQFVRVFVFSLLCTACHEEDDEAIFFGAYLGLELWEKLRSCEEIETIWGFLYREIPRKKLVETQKKAVHFYVQECLNYLERYYYERISLETAAEHLGISSFYLSRVLKRETGKTFVEFLTDIRLLAAMEKMWKREESFQKITEQIGYDSVSYFYKLFKKKMDISAGEMRRQLKRIL